MDTKEVPAYKAQQARRAQRVRKDHLDFKVPMALWGRRERKDLLVLRAQPARPVHFPDL